MTASPSVSVIIPVHNGGDAFRQCLKSLRLSERAPDEVVVVVDGGTDGSRRQAEAAGALVLANPQARGPAHARNRGARAASGDVLFFVDADVTVHPDTVGKVAAAFGEDPGLDALIGSYDDAPAAPNFLSQYRNLLHHFTHQQASGRATTFWGACGAVRRGVFLEAGGFDERYRRPCIEDIELGYRLAQAGRRIRLRKDVQVKHWKTWRAAAMIKTDFFQRALPWTELMLRRRRLDHHMNVDARGRLSVAAAFAGAGALAGAFWFPTLIVPAGLMSALLAGLNAPFYRFLWRTRGAAFAARAMPWHGLYFLYSGLAFLVGLGRHAGRRLAHRLQLHPAA